MSDRRYYQEESPWVEMSAKSWETLTQGRVSKHFSKGHIFYNQQEYSDDIYVIERGRVAMCLCTPEGGMRIAAILSKDCIFGNQTLFDDNPNSCQAQVLSDEGAAVFAIPKEQVKALLRTHREIAYSMLIQSNKINRMLLTQIELMSFRRSNSRVCFYLMHMAEQYSCQRGGQQYLQIRFTHQDIADASGLSRVCVSNVISSLIKEGILKKKAGSYLVADPERLRNKLIYSKLSDAPPTEAKPND